MAAASSIDTRTYYSSGGSRVELDSPLADEVAARAIEQRGIRTRAEVLTEDDVVMIVLRSESPTTLLRLIGVDAIPVGASASAVAFPQVVPTVP